METHKSFYRVRFGVIYHDDSHYDGGRRSFFEKEFKDLYSIVKYVREMNTQRKFWDGPTVMEVHHFQQEIKELKKEDLPDLNFHVDWW